MSRSYCITLNNYSDDDLDNLKLINCRYLIVGKETGASGTRHLQGYIEFDRPHRIKAVSKMIPKAHLEKRMGTREQARTYCMKDNDFLEFGNWESGGQGTRNDIKALMSNIAKGLPKKETMEETPEVYGRYFKFAEAYRAECEKVATREFRHVDVEVLIGDAGTGKTRYVHENSPGVFTVNSGESFPFDGYDGEKSILIDDFYGGIKYHEILRILDGHQYRVNVKGSHRYAQWTKVYITSNKEPSEWYQMGLTNALNRRIKTVTKFCNEVGGNSMAPTNDILI